MLTNQPKGEGARGPSLTGGSPPHDLVPEIIRNKGDARWPMWLFAGEDGLARARLYQGGSHGTLEPW